MSWYFSFTALRMQFFLRAPQSQVFHIISFNKVSFNQQSGFKPTLNYRFGGRGAPPEVSPPDYTYDNRLHTVEDIDGNTEKSVSYSYVR